MVEPIIVGINIWKHFMYREGGCFLLSWSNFYHEGPTLELFWFLIWTQMPKSWGPHHRIIVKSKPFFDLLLLPPSPLAFCTWVFSGLKVHARLPCIGRIRCAILSTSIMDKINGLDGLISNSRQNERCKWFVRKLGCIHPLKQDSTDLASHNWPDVISRTPFMDPVDADGPQFYPQPFCLSAIEHIGINNCKTRLQAKEIIRGEGSKI